VLTDLVQIKLLGEKKRAENERFRKHMKSFDHSDRILRRIAEGIEDSIDCLECANCCRVATAKVTERDVERLILRRDKQTGCVFLSGNECTVYDARPEGCQKFPHVVRGNGSIVSRMWELIDRACYCPIVYNSLEAFKDEMEFKR
jgi:Fe-S-cluster containining protein